MPYRFNGIAFFALSVGLCRIADAAVIYDIVSQCASGCIGTANTTISLIDSYVPGTMATPDDVIGYTYVSSSGTVSSVERPLQPRSLVPEVGIFPTNSSTSVDLYIDYVGGGTYNFLYSDGTWISEVIGFLSNTDRGNSYTVTRRSEPPDSITLSAYALLQNSVEVYSGSNWSEFQGQYDIKSMTSLFNPNAPPYAPTGIGAKFSPNANYTVETAAQALGFDHFNWYQRVTLSDGTSFIDPTVYCYDYLANLQLGVSSCSEVPNHQNRDLLPWYLDEEFSLDGTRIYELGGNRVAPGLTRLEEWTPDLNTLLFSDSPGGQSASFLTCLAGVRADGTGSVFSFSGSGPNPTCFEWEADGSGISVITEEGANSGSGIVRFLGFLAGDFTANDRRLFAERGIDVTSVSQVPEPSTFVLFGIGLAGLAALRRYKHAPCNTC